MLHKCLKRIPKVMWKTKKSRSRILVELENLARPYKAKCSVATAVKVLYG